MKVMTGVKIMALATLGYASLLCYKKKNPESFYCMMHTIKQTVNDATKGIKDMM